MGGAGGDKGGDAAAPLPTVTVGTARTGVIANLLPVTGTLNTRRDQEATIGPPVAGVIDALPVRFGLPVARGQVLFHLSTRTLQGQVASARATVVQNALLVRQAEANALQQQGQSGTAISQARIAISAGEATVLSGRATLTGVQAALENARQNLARSEKLFGEGLVAQKDVEAAQLAVRTADAQVAAQRQTIASQEKTVESLQEALAGARAARIQDTVKARDIDIARQQLATARGALATAEAQEAIYTVRSPIAGTVLLINGGLGETVDTTTKVVTVANIDRLLLQISIPSGSSSLVHAGQGLTFRVDALPGKIFSARIRSVGTQVDTTNSTVTALADVDNSRHLLKDNLAARVDIVLARHIGAVLAPRAGVFIDTGTGGATASVLKIDGKSVVHKVEVRTGLSEGDHIEILSGVHPGDRLATTGGYGLADGTKVETGTKAEGGSSIEGSGKSPAAAKGKE